MPPSTLQRCTGKSNRNTKIRRRRLRLRLDRHGQGLGEIAELAFLLRLATVQLQKGIQLRRSSVAGLRMANSRARF